MQYAERSAVPLIGENGQFVLHDLNLVNATVAAPD